jgi:prolipoprotein diacylglyceryl transferase
VGTPAACQPVGVLPAGLAPLIASLPSPSFDHVDIGPIPLRLYGMCIAAGVVAACVIAQRRWTARGGDPDDITTIAIWAVPAGVIGARLYHVATDWKKYQHDLGRIPQITQGGLGIPGGIALGVLVGLWVVRRHKLPALDLLDVVAPALPVAQAVGRLGNWFNQELYGRPTSLPWGLKIDEPPAGYALGTTFHPTFLYEALWNLALAAFLVVLDRRKVLRRGELFTIYVLGYAIGRLWVEELRIDPASLIFGVRVNIWMSVIVGVVAAVVFARNRLRPKVEVVDGLDRYGDDAPDTGTGTEAHTGTGTETADGAGRPGEAAAVVEADGAHEVDEADEGSAGAGPQTTEQAPDTT